MDVEMATIIALVALYMGGFGGLYWHFMTLINQQLNFNDLVLKRMGEIENPEKDDISVIVNSSEFQVQQLNGEEE